jgi:hypothetical protein
VTCGTFRFYCTILTDSTKNGGEKTKNMIAPGITILFKIFSIIISSWLLIHLLAAFGIFLVIAYPIWWFIAPTKTVCLECRTRRELKWCNFCRHTIENGQFYPKNLRSSLLNSLLILVFSLVSLALVYGETKLISRVSAEINKRTATFTVPSDVKHKIGQTFPFEISIDGIRTPINTVQVDLSYDPQTLEVVEVSTHKSFATVFIEKEIYNEIGFMRLTGGLPNPGFQQENGVFGTVYFRGKSAGITEIVFLPTSVVLANDGKGTNILSSFATASVLILAEPILEEEVASEADIILEPLVLGQAAEGTQLHLYTQTRDRDVLGLSLEDGQMTMSVQDDQPGILERLANILYQIDNFIIEMWKQVYHFMTKPLNIN